MKIELDHALTVQCEKCGMVIALRIPDTRFSTNMEKVEMVVQAYQKLKNACAKHRKTHEKV